MKRDIERLSNLEFDVLVVGGGIHGAIIAWDAALRGLSVGLIERGDFGSATSQNSLKLIHGGLRYLQDANVMRVRMMAQERSTWMKIAPHLVHPLPCLTPTYPKPSRSRMVMRIALKLNDIFAYDRNHLIDEDKHLPAGRILSLGDTIQLLPGLDVDGLTGAALWYDAQMYNSERLLLEFVLSTARHGAAIANYVEAVGLVHQGTVVTGVQARDILTGHEFDIKSKLVINSTGAWIDKLLDTLGKPISRTLFNPSIALNLVVRQVWENIAVGLPSHPRQANESREKKWHSQMFFIVPWREKSIIGTWHIPWPHPAETFELTDILIQEFVNEVNSAHSGLKLSLNDIEHVLWGFLPMENPIPQSDGVNLRREGSVVDHLAEDGWYGLISILGVKYTTARMIAEKAVDLAMMKLSLRGPKCQTHITPVVGGKIHRFTEYLAQAKYQAPVELDPETIEHLVYTYGAQYTQVTEYIAEQPAFADRVNASQPVIRSEIVHAVRQEMALTLGDVIYRRTELGALGLPELHVLQDCAELMGLELGWDDERQIVEIERLIQNSRLKRREGALT